MPTMTRVYPPVTHRTQELAQAFREAVSIVHDLSVEHPRRFAKHDAMEDPDFGCRNPWCVRWWAMVREAEAASALAGEMA
jgi:hypothetical protein